MRRLAGGLRSFALSSLVLFGLVGCAALPELPGEQAAARAAFAERSALVEEVGTWRLAGRLTLELPDETWTGQLGWRTEGPEQVIDLSGPMGRGGGRLVLDGQRAVLLTRDGEQYQASDPDQLIARITGREIPVSGLDAWVRGIARPGTGFDLRADVAGRPSRLIQDGWEIVYGAFEDAGAAAMPSSLELRRRDMRLELRIQRWQLGPPVPAS
ncbi:MAG: outer membrane lipoprotein LolB [Thioalkalivibrio sp.]|nr:MAG: outer membrane lipoprotein LolB [Thioalkalivibrio sp.]